MGKLDGDFGFFYPFRIGNGLLNDNLGVVSSCKGTCFIHLISVTRDKDLWLFVYGVEGKDEGKEKKNDVLASLTKICFFSF